MSFKADAETIVQALNDFYERSPSGEGPVIHQPPVSALIADMELPSLVRDGGLSGEKLAQFILAERPALPAFDPDQSNS